MMSRSNCIRTLKESCALMSRGSIHMMSCIILLLLGLSTSSALDSYKEPKRCGSVDIGVMSNEIVPLPDSYRDCEILEGYLSIKLIENYNDEEKQQELIQSIRFPNLVQVTEYVMIYRVSPLKSIDEILPKLSVIRGHNLFHGYGLVIFANPSLEKLGLDNLTDVLNGSVRIEKNWVLCPGLPNRWETITKSSATHEVINVIQNNHIYCFYDPCEVKNNCSTKPKNNYKICSDITGVCTQGPECHDECAGGCYKPNDSSACVACRNFLLDGMCINACSDSASHYIVDKKYMCVDKCIGNSYTQVIDDKGLKGKTCNQNQCISTTITSDDLGENLKDCEQINGHLIISVDSGYNVAQQLEENLKNIVNVTDYVKVFGSHILYSLNFLKNLKSIFGKDLVDDKYALYVMENENLQELWDTNERTRNLTIGNNGSFLFYFNPKLCPVLIDDLKKASNVTEISSSRNGQSQTCYETEMDVTVKADQVGSIKVTWTYAYQGVDRRHVIGYFVFYREASHDITLFESRDACNDERLWDRSYSEYTENRTETIIGLEPYTRYAVYVMAYYTEQVKRNGARSRIHYVTTLPSSPSPIRNFKPKERRPDQLVLTWKPPSVANGQFSHYDIVYEMIGKPPVANKSPKPDGCEKNDNDEMEIIYERKEYKSLHQEPEASESSTLSSTFSTSYRSTSVKNDRECCSCDDSQRYFDTTRYANDRQSMIMFENFLLNRLYVSLNASKNGTTSRRKRTVTVNSTTPNSTTKNNTTCGKTQTPFQTTDTTFTLMNLTSYTEYEVSIRACNKGEDGKLLCNECQTYPRFTTSADKMRNHIAYLDVGIVGDEDQNSQDSSRNYSSNLDSSSIRLKWPAPTNPNGDPLYYLIKIVYVDDLEVSPKLICVSEDKAREDNYTYTLKESLRRGRYNISIKLRSEGTDGDFTTVSLPVSYSHVLYFIIIIPMLCGICLGILILQLCKKPTHPNDADDQLEHFVIHHNKTYGDQILSALAKINEKYIIEANCLIREKELAEGNFGRVYLGRYKDPSGKERKVAIKSSKTNDEATTSSRDRSTSGRDNSIHSRDSANTGRDFTTRVRDDPTHSRAVRGNGTAGKRGVTSNYELGNASSERSNASFEGNGTTCGSELDYNNRSNQIAKALSILEEVEIMQDINSAFVVALIGVSREKSVRDQIPSLYVVMELMENGNLKDYLKKRQELAQPLQREEILRMSLQAADGMAYLASRKIVHRDLAARNCLLDAKLTLKISDFGLSRFIVDKPYYRIIKQKRVPFRSMAPESLKESRYTTKSDVWSYGILLWEIYSNGSDPYPRWEIDKIKLTLFSDSPFCLDQPEECPEEMYSIIQDCCKKDPDERLSFVSIIRRLLNFIDDDYKAEYEEVSFFHKSAGSCSEDNDEGFNASGSLDSSLKEYDDGENSLSSSLPNNDDRVFLTPDDHNKRSSCASLSCLSSSLTSQGIRMTPTREAPYKPYHHRSSCFTDI